MKQLEYDAMVMQLAKPGVDIASQITPLQAHQLHMAVGVAGESGELLDAIKKHVVYRNPLDIQNVIEELGDLEFFMSGLRQSIGVTREVTLTRNYHKLMMKRYPNGYTDQAAQDRADKAEPLPTIDESLVPKGMFNWHEACQDKKD